jgi:hypothetical protein
VPNGAGPRLLSAQDAAADTGFNYTTLRDAALRGHLPVVRIPGHAACGSIGRILIERSQSGNG